MADFLPVVPKTPQNGTQQAWEPDDLGQSESFRASLPPSSPKYHPEDGPSESQPSISARSALPCEAQRLPSRWELKTLEEKDLNEQLVIILKEGSCGSAHLIPGTIGEADECIGQADGRNDGSERPGEDDNIVVNEVEGLTPKEQGTAQEGRLSPMVDLENNQVIFPNRPRFASTDSTKQTKCSNRSSTNSYAISQNVKNAIGIVNFREGVETSMQEYLENHCADGLSRIDRVLATLKILMHFVLLLPLLSFGVLLLPLAPPEEGFLANWVFNYVSHPILNYFVSRAMVEGSILRALPSSERPRLAWIPRWFPLVGVAMCLFIHIIGNSLGHFPMPFVVSTSCIPSMGITAVVAGHFIPSEFFTPEMRNHMRFLYLSLLSLAAQFGVLFIWLLAFPNLPVALQLLSSCVVTGMLAAAGFLVNEVGRRCMQIPGYVREEQKIIVLFVAFLFSSALLPGAKSGLVLCVILILDAGKAIAIAVKMCHHLVAIAEEENKETHPSGPSGGWCWCFLSLCHFRPSLLVQKASTAFYVRQKLKGVIGRLSKMTSKELDDTWIDVHDAMLLNELVRYLKTFVLVELCEVMVPLMYMLVIVTLNSTVFGYNKERFYLFDQLDETYDDAIIGNALSFLIEAVVLLAAEVMIFRSIGFDMIHFAGVALRQDYSFWLLALTACCCAWLTVLVKHGGHNLYFWRSVLFPN